MFYILRSGITWINNHIILHHIIWSLWLFHCCCSRTCYCGIISWNIYLIFKFLYCDCNGSSEPRSTRYWLEQVTGIQCLEQNCWNKSLNVFSDGEVIKLCCVSFSWFVCQLSLVRILLFGCNNVSLWMIDKLNWFSYFQQSLHC